MKRIPVVLYIILITLFACEKDETQLVIKSDATPPKIIVPTADSDIEITESKLSDEIEFTWSDTDYGVPTEVTYTVEIDAKCNSFANPVTLGASNSGTLEISVETLNSKLVNDFKLAPHQLSELEVRIKSVINNKFVTLSNPVPITVTPWSTKPVALWLGENASTAPVIYAKGPSEYEGYKYYDKDAAFRLSTNPICAKIVYGASGTPGSLSTSGSSEIAIDSGYYKINADTDDLTFNLTPIGTWGMIGTATPGGWNSSTPLTYIPSRDVWEAELQLIEGALKFRANNDWGINYGPAVIADLQGKLVQTNDAINIVESGKYIVTLDFSQSAAPYAYKYTVAKSGDIPEPAKLWVPGSYQGWNPGGAPTIYATGASTFEGFVDINAGAGFKFTSAPDWDHINYGDSGTAGLLTTDGTKPSLGVPVAGYYRFMVNTSTLAYSIDLIETMGLIGTSTTGGWDTSTPMTYDQANNVWKITTDLAQGALKFRANNGWGINYGVADINALDGNLIFDAPSINITEAGNYTVTLDFSRSASPYKYTYKLKKN